MLEPADLLILDEPTNDLDIPTLEVLEDSLAEFEGGLVLVTHDRFMLERVSNVILALDGEGGRRDVRGLRAVGSDPGRPGAGAARSSGGAGVDARETEGQAPGLSRAARVGRDGAGDPGRRDRRRSVPARGGGSRASPRIRRRSRPATRRSQAARALVDRLYARWAELEAKQPEA